MPVTAGETLAVTIQINSNADVQLKRASQAVNNFARESNQSLGRAEKGFAGLRNSLTLTANAVNRLAGRWIAMATTITGTLAVFRSVSDAQKFGIAIAEIGTIFSGTEGQLAAVEDRILALSETLGLAETIAAKGFYQIISADITNAAEAMVVLEESAELATVGLADIAQTVDVVTSIIKAYGLQVSEAAKITDVLFQTVILGKTTIPELSTSLGQVLPISATLAIRLEEVAAAIATLTQGGIETNTTVIQLRQAFNQLLKPSAEAAAILRAYNIDLSVARIRSEGFASIITELREKVQDNASAYARLFGNIRGLIPILALTGDRYEQFNRVLDANDKALGRVGASLEIFLESPFKRFQVFFNAIRLQFRRVGETFIREFNAVIQERGGVEAVTKRFGAAFSSLEEVAKGVAQAFGRALDQLDVFITRFGGLERAEQLFRSIGKIVATTGELFVQGLVAGINLAIQAVIELARFFSQLAFEGKSAANAIAKAFSTGPLPDIEVPFPDIAGAEQILAAERAIVRLRKKVRELEKIQERNIERGVDQRFIDRVQSEIDRILVLRQEQEAFLAKAREGGGLGLDTPALGTLEDASAALDKFASGAGEALSRWKQARQELGAVLRGETIATDVETRITASLELDIDEEAEREKVRVAAEKLKLELTAEAFVILENIRVLTGIEIGLELEEPLFEGELEHIVEGVRRVFEDITGIQITPGFDPEQVLDAVNRYSQLTELVAELNNQIDRGATSARTEIEGLQQTFNVRRKLFDQALQELALTQETHAEVISLFDDAEQAQREAVIGFDDFSQFFRKLAGEADVPWAVSVDGIKRTQAELEVLRGAALEIGAITEEEFRSLGVAIEKNVLEKLRKLQEDLAGQRFELLRGDVAFELGSLNALQQGLRDSAAAAARLETGIDHLTVEGTADFERLQESYERFLKKLTTGGEAFGAGFLARLRDITAELEDAVALGARLADDLAGAFQGGFRTGISAALLQEDDALDQAREAFARGLADAVANALSDQLTGLATKALGFIGEAIFGPLEGLGEDVSEATALARITDAALRALVQVEGSAVTAVGTIEGAFVQAGATLQTPADLLLTAANLQIQAAEAVIALTGGKPAVEAGAGIAGDAAAKEATEAGTDSAKIAADAAALEAGATAALAPAAGALVGSADASSAALLGVTSGLGGAGAELLAAGGLGSSAGSALLAAAATLDAAAVALGATAGLASGGFTQGPIIQGFAHGTQTIPKRLTEIGAGGVKTQELLTRVREGSQNEAVVPLPGNGREIPVEFRNPEALSRSGGSIVLNQEAHLHLNVTSDDRSFKHKVLATMPEIERALAATLGGGANRALETAVRSASRGA